MRKKREQIRARNSLQLTKTKTIQIKRLKQTQKEDTWRKQQSISQSNWLKPVRKKTQKKKIVWTNEWCKSEDSGAIYIKYQK